MQDTDPFVPRVPGIDYGVLDTLLGYAVRRAQIRLYEDFVSSLAPWGITPPRFSAMVIVSRNPGLKLIQLAKVLGIARSGVVILVDALEELGYMQRQAVPEDRRAFSLSLTQKGQTELVEIVKAVREHDVRMAASLTEAEQTQLLSLLSRLASGEP